MQSLSSLSFINNPLVYVIAAVVGMVPSVIWLLFWLREDSDGRHEPTGLVTITFVAGMLAVIFVLPIEKFVASLAIGNAAQITLWAASEEILKYFAFAIVMSRSAYLDEPVDQAIYLMTAALGFAALENSLYLVHPVAVNDTTVSFLTGNLRFLGSTLLHAVTSGVLGISIGLAYFKSKGTKTLYAVIGLCAAIALHSVFNFFIMKNNGENFLQVFGFLWVVAIIIMLLFEKLRRMGAYLSEDTQGEALPQTSSR